MKTSMCPYKHDHRAQKKGFIYWPMIYDPVPMVTPFTPDSLCHLRYVKVCVDLQQDSEFVVNVDLKGQQYLIIFFPKRLNMYSYFICHKHTHVKFSSLSLRVCVCYMSLAICREKNIQIDVLIRLTGNRSQNKSHTCYSKSNM